MILEKLLLPTSRNIKFAYKYTYILFTYTYILSQSNGKKKYK